MIITILKKSCGLSVSRQSIEHNSGCLNIEKSRVGKVKRFPTNLFVTKKAAKKMDQQSGYLKTGKVASHSDKGMWSSGADIDYADQEKGGGASRFFKNI